LAFKPAGLALNIVKTNAELKAQIALWKSDNQTIGFVPTMGALHKGHLHLLEVAKTKCSRTICSVFVNPTQFNDASDFDRYPRTLESDIEKLQETSCDLLFAPSVGEIYPNGSANGSDIDFGEIANVMEGKHRPGHFNGVGNVVKRLFELTAPDTAFFGLKDYQQYCIIKQLIEIYKLPIEIVGVPTVREQDGLAMSSRNTLLDPLHRELAPVIYQAMLEAKNNIQSMPVSNVKLLVEQRLLALPDVKIDYVEIANANNLQTISRIEAGTKARIFIAAFFGKIRLIDNLELL
jgi:pantoate--beta-alanine ligase